MYIMPDRYGSNRLTFFKIHTILLTRENFQHKGENIVRRFCESVEDGSPILGSLSDFVSPICNKAAQRSHKRLIKPLHKKNQIQIFGGTKRESLPSEPGIAGYATN